MARRGILVIIGTLLLQDIPFRYGSFLVSEKRLMRDNCSRIWTVILTQGIPFLAWHRARLFLWVLSRLGRPELPPRGVRTMHCAIDVIGIPLGPWAGNPKEIMNPATNAACLSKHSEAQNRRFSGLGCNPRTPHFAPTTFHGRVIRQSENSNDSRGGGGIVFTLLIA